jgi:hypothetical protein
VEKTRYKLSSDYPRTIEIWSNAFGRGAVYIDFFDRLQNDPEATSTALCNISRGNAMGASLQVREKSSFCDNWLD